MGFFGLTGRLRADRARAGGMDGLAHRRESGPAGWAGLGAILLTLTGIGTIVPVILLWVFAFMRWPRDELASAAAPSATRAQVGLAPPTGPTTGPAARQARRWPCLMSAAGGWPARWATAARYRSRSPATLGQLRADGRPGRRADRSQRARSVGRPAPCTAPCSRADGWVCEDLGTPGRDLHRWRPPVARAWTARHQRRALGSPRHCRSCPDAGLK